MRIAHDPHVAMPAVYLDDDPDGAPDFTRQNMGRQREAMARGLCQVCWRPIPWARRRIVIANLSVAWIDVDGRQVPAVTEPWLCDRCATFAVEVCPALIRRTRDEQLTVISVTSARDVSYTVSTGWVDGPLEEQTRQTPPAMWVKLILPVERVARAVLEGR
jgi:hypothetical protein